MNYLDLFSGIGGFSEGFRRAGWHFDKHYFSEINPYAIKIYQRHFPDAVGLGSITGINPEELGQIDIITFGFPCQDLSVAGRQSGFEGKRSVLFFEACRIIQYLKPSLFVFENVEGLFSSNEGKDFETVLRTISEIGVYDCEWQLINTAWFLPQNRERVYFIGHLRGKSWPKVFPITESSSKHIQKIETQGKEISQCLTTRSAKSRQGEAYTWVRVAPVLTPNRKEKRQNGRQIKKFGEPSFTLTTQDHHGITDGEEIREMTPTEWARLQGFKDNWCDGISDAQKYKALGNAVTVDVVECIAKRLLIK